MPSVNPDPPGRGGHRGVIEDHPVVQGL